MYPPALSFEGHVECLKCSGGWRADGCLSLTSRMHLSATLEDYVDHFILYRQIQTLDESKSQKIFKNTPALKNTCSKRSNALEMSYFLYLLYILNFLMKHFVDSHLMKLNIQYLHFLALVTKRSAALSSATQHNVSRIRRKMRNVSVLIWMECLNTRFPGCLCLHCYVRDTAWN